MLSFLVAATICFKHRGWFMKNKKSSCPVLQEPQNIYAENVWKAHTPLLSWRMWLPNIQLVFLRGKKKNIDWILHSIFSIWKHNAFNKIFPLENIPSSVPELWYDNSPEWGNGLKTYIKTDFRDFFFIIFISHPVFLRGINGNYLSNKRENNISALRPFWFSFLIQRYLAKIHSQWYWCSFIASYRLVLLEKRKQRGWQD